MNVRRSGRHGVSSTRVLIKLRKDDPDSKSTKRLRKDERRLLNIGHWQQSTHASGAKDSSRTLKAELTFGTQIKCISRDNVPVA